MAQAAPQVLILDETVQSPATSSKEYAGAVLAGFSPVVVNAATWSGMTTAQFASYRAIILGDPNCGTSAPGYINALNVLNTTKFTWGPAVTGNIILAGVDNALHSGGQIGAQKLLDRGILFSTSDPAGTGLYYALSCYYDYTAPAAPFTPVPHLDAFGVFKVRNFPGQCFNDAHQTAIHAVFTAAPALTDAELSNWSCSVHEGFDAWPPNFIVLAIASNNASVYTAPDGSQGVPYILVRGKGITVLTSIVLTPPTATNVLGTTHTVCATISNTPLAGVTVKFTIIGGPNAPLMGTAVTDPTGKACFTYTGSGGLGTDFIIASYVNSAGKTNTSATVTKTWVAGNPCLSLANESVNCVTNGKYNYTFTFTNLTSGPIGYVSFVDLPTGAAVVPSSIIPLSPLVPPGGSRTVTVMITDTTTPARTNICFRMGIHNANFELCCAVTNCISLPKCCIVITKQSIKQVATNTYNYTFVYQNLTGLPVSYVFLVPKLPCFSFSPNIINLSGSPIPPFGSATITTTITVTPGCGPTLCFFVSGHDANLAECCSIMQCITIRPVIISSPKGTDIFTAPALIPVTLSLGADPNSVLSDTVRVRYMLETNVVLTTTALSSTVTLSNVAAGTRVLSVELLDANDVTTVTPTVSFLVRPAGTPVVPRPVQVGKQITISISTQAGEGYQVEYTDSLSEPQWKLLQTVPGNGNVITITDSIENSPQRFYRIRVP